MVGRSQIYHHNPPHKIPTITLTENLYELVLKLVPTTNNRNTSSLLLTPTILGQLLLMEQAKQKESNLLTLTTAAEQFSPV